jgi:hypothetical protein
MHFETVDDPDRLRLNVAAATLSVVAEDAEFEALRAKHGCTIEFAHDIPLRRRRIPARLNGINDRDVAANCQ